MSNQTMRALTLHQPWAHAIAHGTKRIENRTWEPPAYLRGKFIAIHAGKTWERPHVLRDVQHLVGGFAQESVSFSAVIAVAKIFRVVFDSEDPWFFGPVGWVFSEVRAIEPVPCKGAQGIWRLPREVHDTVMERAQKARVCRG